MWIKGIVNKIIFFLLYNLLCIDNILIIDVKILKKICIFGEIIGIGGKKINDMYVFLIFLYLIILYKNYFEMIILIWVDWI